MPRVLAKTNTLVLDVVGWYLVALLCILSDVLCSVNATTRVDVALCQFRDVDFQSVHAVILIARIDSDIWASALYGGGRQ